MTTTTHYKLTHIDTTIDAVSYKQGVIAENICCRGRINYFDISFTGNSKKDIAINLNNLFEHDIKSEDITIDRDEYATFIQLNLLENNYGYEPTSYEMENWKNGKIKLYNASYIWELTKETVETAVKVID